MTEIVLNHLTRMKDDRVCVAGLTADGTHVRPLLPRQRPWTEEHVCPRGPLRLGSRLAFTGEARRPDPPHTEDYVVDEWDVAGTRDYAGFLGALSTAAVPLELCFGAAHDVVPGRHVVLAPGTGACSLAVVRTSSADLYQRAGRLRVGLEHASLGDVDMKVNDVRFVPWTQRREQMPRLSALMAATGALLTIGLTRPWPRGEAQQWCWLQINGIFVEDVARTGW